LSLLLINVIFFVRVIVMLTAVKLTLRVQTQEQLID